MRLSIIIPMYNVELYIEKCLLSCLSQDIPSCDYEIIIVDDGSPDNSKQIAERIAEQANNIRIITQTNRGLSVARNIGLKNAKGKYVWFVDSDDWIEENCLSSLCDVLEKRNVDLCQIQYRYSFDNSQYNKDYFYSFDEMSGKEVLSLERVVLPAPFAIYRREFLVDNNLQFYPAIYHEDCEFKPRVLFFAKRCISYDKVVYNYYQGMRGSITTNVNPQRSFDYIKVALSIAEFYETVAKGECSFFFHNHISLMINNALSVTCGSREEFSRELYRQKKLFVHLRKSSVIKYKIEGWLFTLFPRYSMEIYNLLCKFK